MDITNIEKSLKGKSNEELDDLMGCLPTEVLLQMINRGSIRIGDTASSLLNRRNETEQVARSILKGLYTTKIGKTRAANTLSFGGLKSKVGDDALLYLVKDRNEEVAGNALFALITLGRINVVKELDELAVNAPPEMKSRLSLAVQSLEKKDPKIYNPFYGS